MNKEDERKLVAGLMTCVTVIALVFNLVTVCVILFNRRLWRSQHVVMFNLAFSDGVASVILMTSQMGYFSGVRIGAWWIEPLFNAALLVSILSTLGIALQRFIMMRYDVNGERNLVSARISIVGCILGWIVIFSLYLLVSRYVDYGVIGYVITPVIVVLCLLVTAVVYVLLYNSASSSYEAIRETDALLRQRVKVHKKVLLTFSLVVGTTSFCWVPMCAVLFTEYFALEKEVDSEAFSVFSSVAFLLVATNGILNPAIYWFRLTEFRTLLKRCCCRCCAQDLETAVDREVEGVSSYVSLN